MMGFDRMSTYILIGAGLGLPGVYLPTWGSNHSPGRSLGIWSHSVKSKK